MQYDYIKTLEGEFDEVVTEIAIDIKYSSNMGYIIEHKYYIILGDLEFNAVIPNLLYTNCGNEYINEIKKILNRGVLQCIKSN